MRGAVATKTNASLVRYRDEKWSPRRANVRGPGRHLGRGADVMSGSYRAAGAQVCEADDDLWMARFLRLANKHGRYQDLPAYLWLNLVVEYCEHGDREYCYDTVDLEAWLDRMVASGRIRRERGPEINMYGGSPRRMIQVENWAILRPRRAYISPKVRAEVMERCRGRCVACGTTDAPTLDHIYPWSKGGSDELDNLQILCRPCNLAKRDRI